MADDAPITKVVEEAAGEQLGVGRWDRPAIFREVADAAVDNGLPYWTLLVLSGAIATLGLALDSSAIVIGAMLVAPLLAPIIALGLAFAVGDARLANQAGSIVVASALAVILTGAVLTAVLPFETITLEISSRIRPSVLDLAVGVFSGVVGAVVTLSRGSRLSAAIPGVAVAVALIPPLAVAGFGIGAGWHGEVIGGSMLLLSANLAGIVLSAMLIFLLVGMQRPEVVAAARKWHSSSNAIGLARWVTRVPWLGSMGVFGSSWGRVVLVGGFVAVLTIPLTTTLKEITREARIRRAISSAEAIFEGPGRASVLSRQVDIARDRTTVYLRVATAEWYDDDARHLFERTASSEAGEPVLLVLEQLPSTTGELNALATLIPTEERAAAPAPQLLPELLELSRRRAEEAVAILPFPTGTRPLAAEVRTRSGGASAIRVVYAAQEPLQAQAAEMLMRALRTALGHGGLGLELERVAVPAGPFELGDGGAPGGSYAATLASALDRYPGLSIELLTTEPPDSATRAELDAAEGALLRAGVDPERIGRRVVEPGEPGVRLRLRAASALLEEAAAPPE